MPDPDEIRKLAGENVRRAVLGQGVGGALKDTIPSPKTSGLGVQKTSGLGVQKTSGQSSVAGEVVKTTQKEHYMLVGKDYVAGKKQVGQLMAEPAEVSMRPHLKLAGLRLGYFNMFKALYGGSDSEATNYLVVEGLKSMKKKIDSDVIAWSKKSKEAIL